MKKLQIILLAALFLSPPTFKIRAAMQPSSPTVVSCPLCKCNFLMEKCEMEFCVKNGLQQPECCRMACGMKNNK